MNAAHEAVGTRTPGLRARQRADRRRKFVDVAERLFLHQGYAGTSVNEVVRIAGGSLATLYAEFGTKENLFEAVIAERVTRAFDAAGEPVGDEGNLEQRLIRLAMRIHERTLSPESLALYRLAVAEGPRFPGLRDVVLDAGLDHFLDRLAGLIERLAADDGLAIGDPTLAARQFLALVQGQHQFIAGCGGAHRLGPAMRRRHVGQAVDAFLRLYRMARAPGTVGPCIAPS
jgi:AcrR family transcriptional regulator